MCIFVLFLVIFLSVYAGSVGADSHGKTVKVVLSEEPDNVESCNSCRSAVGRVVLKNIVEPLTEINPNDGSLVPRLATSWKQIDPTTWQMTLRKGVKFHDGADFNAEAVKYSINRLMDKSVECEVRFKFLEHLTMTPTVVDSHTVNIKTSVPEPIFPTLMGTVTITSPNTPMGKWSRHPVGTGPYKFVKWDAGKEIVLERFDGYWGEKPQVEKAVYVWRSESAVRAAMVKTGEADIAPNLAVQDANDPKMDTSYFNSETSRLRIDTTTPPTSDRRVRQALNYAIDRDAIRGSVLSKDVVAATQLVTPAINGYNPELKVWPYDPEKAKKLIAEARKDGVPVDKELLMVGRVGIYPNATEVMEVALSMYQEIGLNVKLKMFEVGVWNNYFTKPFPKEPAAIQQGQHDNNNGDPIFTVFNKYACEGGQSNTCNKDLDALVAKAQIATGAERTKLWQQVFKMVNDDIISDVPLFHMVGYTRVGKRINFQPSIATNSELQIAQITFK
jgi:peptide/nickel transport system substrate-binding protein